MKVGGQILWNVTPICETSQIYYLMGRRPMRDNHRYAVVVQDLPTQWIQSYPCNTKTSQETQKSLQKFSEPNRKLKVIYTGNSLEFGKSCEELSWNHSTSTPHRSETNRIAERAVRRVKEGTSAVLLQSGLDEKWWADSMESFSYLRNIQDLLSDGKTPYERRFGQPFRGPIIPFGSLVELSPYNCKGPVKNPSIWKESLTDGKTPHERWVGIPFNGPVIPFGAMVIGYVLYVEKIWKGDILVANNAELEEMDASELHARRLNAKKVLTPMKGDNFIFPVADGTVKVPGGDRSLRPSTLIRDLPERGEEQEVFRGESDELPSPNPLQDDSTLVNVEAKNDFWSLTGDFMYRNHVGPRVKLHSPREESFPIPLKYIDVSRNGNLRKLRFCSSVPFLRRLCAQDPSGRHVQW